MNRWESACRKRTTKGASSQTTRKVSFCLDYDEEPEPGEVLNFISKAQLEKGLRMPSIG